MEANLISEGSQVKRSGRSHKRELYEQRDWLGQESRSR